MMTDRESMRRVAGRLVRAAALLLALGVGLPIVSCLVILVAGGQYPVNLCGDQSAGFDQLAYRVRPGRLPVFLVKRPHAPRHFCISEWIGFFRILLRFDNKPTLIMMC